MSEFYVRITPYNKKQGALAMRIGLGGRVFEAGQWYTMAGSWAGKMSKLTQEGGAPVFEIMDKDAFEATSRAEMLALMRAQGIAGLATQGAVPSMPVAKTHKDGPKESAFSGMSEDVKEVEMVEPPPPPVTAAPEPEDVPETSVADRSDDDWEDD